VGPSESGDMASEHSHERAVMRTTLWTTIISIIVCAHPAFAQGQQPQRPPELTSYVQGWMTWDTKVNQVHRKGKCSWTLKFTADGREYAAALDYQNEDTDAPFSDQRRVVRTTANFGGLQEVNGRLRYAQTYDPRRRKSFFNFSYVMPTYGATQVEEVYTWDPYRRQWSRQSSSPTQVVNVLCGPGEIGAVEGPIGSFGPALVDARPLKTFDQQVPQATLLNKWSFQLPSGARPSSPRLGQAPDGVPSDCAAILQRERELTQMMISQPTWESQQAIKQQHNAIEPEAMACRRAMNGLPPIASDGAPVGGGATRARPR
jgi:hypothetical protein